MIVTRAQMVDAGASVTQYWWSLRVTDHGSRIIKNNLCYIYDTTHVRAQLESYLKTVERLSEFNKARATATCQKVLNAIKRLETKSSCEEE